MKIPPAENVFGARVKGKDRKESAIKAYNNPNAAEKRSMTVNYVKAKKDNWGRTGVATLCIFYNATGKDLMNVKDFTNSKNGHFHITPPVVVQNGQWGAFLHVQEVDHVTTVVSEGFVAYKGLIKDTTSNYTNQLLGWMTTRSINTIHCDIFDANVDPPSPNQIYTDIETNPQSDVERFEMHVIAAPVEDGINIYKYVLTRDDVI